MLVNLYKRKCYTYAYDRVSWVSGCNGHGNIYPRTTIVIQIIMDQPELKRYLPLFANLTLGGFGFWNLFDHLILVADTRFHTFISSLGYH